MAAPLPDQPDDLSNMMEIARAATAQVNVCLPASVVSYDKTSQTATVRLGVAFAYRGNGKDSGKIMREKVPDLPNTPVAFPSAGGWSITWPLSAGDTGIVIFADRAIDAWRGSGAAHSEPADFRRHDLTDGIFIPGGRPDGAAIPVDGVDDNAMVIRGAEMKLGSSLAVQPVALAPIVSANMSTLQAAVSAAIAAASTAGTAQPTTALAFPAFAAAFASAFTAALAAFPVDMGSTTTKAL